MARIVVDSDAPPWAHDMARQIERLLEARALPSYSKSNLPGAKPAGQQIYVTDEAGGAIVAFSDGLVWRRVTDRAVIS